MRWRLNLALGLLCLFLNPILVAEENCDSLVITEITFTGDHIEDPERVLASMGLVVGAPLDRKQIREGVLTLFAGGDVEYFNITKEMDSGGLKLNLDVRLKSRIREFRIVGVNYIWRKRIEDWFELRPGMPVSAAGIETGARRASSRIRERGWSAATIEAFVDYDRVSNTVVVEAVVELGLEDTIASLEIVGLPDDRIDEVMPEFKVGKVLDQNLVDRLRENVEVGLRRLGFWEGVVTKIEKRGEAPGFDLVIRVNPGRRYLLVIDSPADAEQIVSRAVPDPATELHPAQTDALKEQIRENLQLEGYLMAEVEIDLESRGDEAVLTVHCDPGPVLEVDSVEFPGAEALSKKTLMKRVGVRKGKTEGFTGRAVSISTLDRDRLVLEALYRQRGFKEVIVDRAVVSRTGEHAVAVSFPISEGQRWMVDSLRLENFPVEAIAVIEETKLIVTSGSPWDPEKIDPLCRTLGGILASQGYPHGRVSAEVAEETEGRVRLVVRAEPGLFVRFGEIVISGLKQTRERVVAEILQRAGLVPGRPHSYTAIIKAQGKLYGLGLFRAVEIVPIPGQERRATRGLVVRCEEGEQRSVLFGVGWDTEENFRITLGWGHLNLFGGAHAVSVEARASSLQLRFQAGLREFSLFGTGVPGYGVIYSTSEDFASYSQQRYGISFEVGDRRRRPFVNWVRFEYQAVEPDAPDDVLSELEREDQRIRLASVLPVIQWDTRDDFLSPTKGFLALLSLEYAFPLYKAEAEFLKMQASYSHYHSMLHGQVALGLRLGLIEPLGLDTGEAPNLQVPLTTRFFAGGRRTHRAFAIDRLGIPGETIDDEGKAIGGNALFLFNLEYTRPVWGMLSATLFLDGGNVWASISSLDLSAMRWGLGFGFRYETPAGPFRLEYGRKLDPQPGESTGQFFFSFGVPF